MWTCSLIGEIQLIRTRTNYSTINLIGCAADRVPRLQSMSLRRVGRRGSSFGPGHSVAGLVVVASRRVALHLQSGLKIPRRFNTMVCLEELLWSPL